MPGSNRAIKAAQARRIANDFLEVIKGLIDLRINSNGNEGDNFFVNSRSSQAQPRVAGILQDDGGISSIPTLSIVTAGVSHYSPPAGRRLP